MRRTVISLRYRAGSSDTLEGSGGVVNAVRFSHPLSSHPPDPSVGVRAMKKSVALVVCVLAVFTPVWALTAVEEAQWEGEVSSREEALALVRRLV